MSVVARTARAGSRRWPRRRGRPPSVVDATAHLRAFGIVADGIAGEVAAAGARSMVAAAIGALALLLSLIGIGAVAAQAVVQRTHEIGVRMALGAGAVDAIALVVRSSIAPVCHRYRGRCRRRRAFCPRAVVAALRTERDRSRGVRRCGACPRCGGADRNRDPGAPRRTRRSAHRLARGVTMRLNLARAAQRASSGATGSMTSWRTRSTCTSSCVDRRSSTRHGPARRRLRGSPDVRQRHRQTRGVARLWGFP